jgi:hypothetical protein
MLRWLFKWLFRIALVLLAITALLVVLRNQILRPVLERRIQQATGLETLIGRVSVEWSEPKIRLLDVRVKNPEGVGNRPFLEIPETSIVYDRTALLNRQLRIHQLQVHVREINVFRPDPGRSTQSQLSRSLGRTDAPSFFRPLSFQGIESLQLSVARYFYLDYVQMARSQELPLRITNATATNIQSLDALTQALQAIARNHGVQWPPSDTAAPASTR